MSDRFTRASGAGNTFWIANIFDPAWAQKFPHLTEQDKAEIAKRICEASDGFGTDGILFVKPEAGFDFSWDFYNSDGSKAEMCGNAARCASLFFYEKIKPQKNLKFLTGAGEISGEILNGKVRVQMTRVHDVRPMVVSGQSGLFVNSGVPHFVISEKPDGQLAKHLRQVSDFGPPGANITFVTALSLDQVAAVTFERGVEDFTQACGTGAVAAALWLQSQKGRQAAVRVQMPGGELLVENAEENSRPLLSGPTKLEFEMTLPEKK